MENVIKIGGSLFPNYAIELVKQLEGTDSVVILGGGEFANLIRKYDLELDLSDKVAHWTAIDAMDIMAKLTADKVESAEIANDLNEAFALLSKGLTPILITSNILRSEDPFENSWDVTSDSIAAYISHMLNANLLIVTDVNGIYTQEPNVKGAKFIDIIDAETLLTFQETSIDLMLPSLLLEFGTNCYVVNGKYPERVLSLIDKSGDTYDFDYTKILGE
ncbi:delta 1-pyrroline-5-carboxylate synthetase [uncultured Methanobrevibacter sp.]|uniref:amino acid kinase family protein n=1 Tax=uncultured Methanobrevibacter sp. TaxID=253161 RepID=UPI0015BF65AC|nr:delta 1-pyrroline-5-carboxylate synthetase [uncultured Methanobrevibacter sp.]